ncbi:MAG: InlB B-repeat-containing protein [Clostridia bacterium]|nr:InlB B-repeat-containing protein [Clostridia bacterium]
MWKKWMAMLLALVLLVSSMPLSVYAAAKDIVTITVTDQNGNKLPNATVTASRVYKTAGQNLRTQTVDITSNRDGTFTYDTSKYYYGTTQYYTAVVSCEGYETVSQQINPTTRAVVITLTSTAPAPDEWVAFDLYYIATGIPPASFTGAGQPQHYGPSGNDVPLVTINVNITKLKNPEYAPYVAYEENRNGNTYHFTPSGTAEDNSDLTEAEKRERIALFWEKVVECMDDESKEAFEATGLMDSFQGYVLKNQGTAQRPDNHCDGILTVEPPVYIVEMNDRGTYFGGFANDQETKQFTKITDVLGAYNSHFKQAVEWVPNGDGTFSGTYVEGKYQYYLKISQTNYASDLYNPVANSDEYVEYRKQTDQYYLATFDAALLYREQIEFTVSYQDGANNKVFHTQMDPVKENEPVPVFRGDVERENYVHLGWMLEGGDGTLLSQEDIVEKYATVTQDLTFIAVYELKPATFAGTVEVVLNGSYASGIATGERVDVDTIQSGVGLAVSADGVNFIPLVRGATGVYSARLENGSYQIYYQYGDTYALSSEQLLDIADAPRTRYLFFNTVTYDANGGQNAPVPSLEYYQTGMEVTVSSTVPTKEGYRFLGWKDQNGVLHQSGAALTAAIGEAYVLTAQWEKILYADVGVTLVIDHKEVSGGINQNRDKSLEIDLTYRPVQSAEDYVEVVRAERTKTDWYEKGNTVNNVTTVTYEALFETLDIAYEYSANVFLSEYEVTDRTVTASTDAEGNVTYHVTVKLRFSPDQYMLKYQVVEHIASDALVPLATDIKVLTWYNPSLEIAGAPAETMWYSIVQHVNTSHDALFNSQDTDADGNQVAYGEYLVWGWEDKEDNRPYYYRIGTVGFTLADGTELTATTEDGIHFTSVATSAYPAGAYTATLVVDGGASPAGTDLDGAYFSQDGNQNGTLTLVVEAHPYNVTFDPNGGTLLGTTNDTVVAEQFLVPDLSRYVPVRGDAYVFDRWVLLDENGNETDDTVNSFDALTSDITLKAKWKEPLTIEGMVTVGATYVQYNDDGSETIQPIYEDDRAKTATVLLQKIDPNGYTETVKSLTLTFDYTDEEYYYNERPVGMAAYAFENIPDDGTQYRIQMLLTNYHSFFQNEPDAASVYKKFDYPNYNDTDYTVEWGTKAPTVGTVNIHNHFEPEEFPLTYTVDASAIGAGFRPESAELLITSDDQPSGYDPSEWTVISQMLINGAFVGEDVALDADGIGHGTNRVWIQAIDSTTHYQYGLRLYKVTLDGETVAYTNELPFTVSYEAPAHWHYNEQSEELKAILTPNTYAIRYELGGGTATGDYPTTHTWSYETALDLAEPTFHGFVFDGWYLDEDFTQEAPAAIDASVAQDTTLYAKWVQAMDVVDLTVIIRHDLPTGGLTGNYNKTLYAQLTSDLRSNEGALDRVFADVEGYKRTYPNGLWHTNGDDITQDVFQAPAFYANLPADRDYSVNVALEGYYVVNKTTEKIAQKDGSTLHQVVVTLQYNPELLDMEFYVRVEDEVPADKIPVSAEVKVTSWHDSPYEDIDWQWFRISQHEATTVTVTIDPATRQGVGTYPVWMWYNKEEGIPYHYRVEVVQLNYADGTASHMTETTDDVTYHGGGYHAQIETAGGSVPYIPNATVTTELEGVHGVVQNGTYVQQGTVGVVIGRHDAVVFHTNNADSQSQEAFRTYYPYGMPDLNDGSYRLHVSGTLDRFYDIPTFEYATHNSYIFKGWYMHPVLEDEPFSWDHAFEGSGDVYAHWITVGEVDKNADDTKNITGETYKEYDLVGVQIRDADLDEVHHGGQAASGLRFITVLSDRIQNEIDNLSDQPLEYGFVMAKTSTLQNYAKGEDYTLEYKHQNTNGVDTRSDYVYAQNMICSKYVDHYEGAAGTYCLYTAVITYEDTPDREAAYATDFTARSYLRYKDANGLTRVHYHNYTGASRVAHGCSTSFATVQGMMGV